jgi:hypothetical protein
LLGQGRLACEGSRPKEMGREDMPKMGHAGKIEQKKGGNEWVGATAARLHTAWEEMDRLVRHGEDLRNRSTDGFLYRNHILEFAN